jgi:hypothetical protein
MLLNRAWMIGKNSPALAPSSWTTGVWIQMLVDGGVATAIAGEPVGQEMRPGGDVGGQKGAEFGASRGGQHGDLGVAGNKAVLALDRVTMLAFLPRSRGQRWHRSVFS